MANDTTLTLSYRLRIRSFVTDCSYLKLNVVHSTDVSLITLPSQFVYSVHSLASVIMHSPSSITILSFNNSFVIILELFFHHS